GDVGLLEKIEDVHLLGIEGVFEAGRDVGDLGEIDGKQEDMGHVDLPRPPQDAGARHHEAAFAHLLAVDEGGGVAGDENEYLGGVTEPVVPDGDPVNTVRRDVVEKDQPQCDPAEQIEPQIASARDHGGGGRGVHIGDLTKEAANPN